MKVKCPGCQEIIEFAHRPANGVLACTACGKRLMLRPAGESPAAASKSAPTAPAKKPASPAKATSAAPSAKKPGQPAKTSAAPPAPAKKRAAPPPVDDEDDDEIRKPAPKAASLADDDDDDTPKPTRGKAAVTPKKKSSLVPMLLLLLLLAGGGGFAAWYFLFNQPATNTARNNSVPPPGPSGTPPPGMGVVVPGSENPPGETGTKIDASYIHDKADFVGMVRPNALIKSPFAKFVPPGAADSFVKELGIPVEEIDYLMLLGDKTNLPNPGAFTPKISTHPALWLMALYQEAGQKQPAAKDMPPPPPILFRTKNPIDPKNVLAKKMNLEEKELDGKKFHLDKSAKEPLSALYFDADNKTIIVGRTEQILPMLNAKESKSRIRDRFEKLDGSEDAFVFFDADKFRDLLEMASKFEGGASDEIKGYAGHLKNLKGLGLIGFLQHATKLVDIELAMEASETADPAAKYLTQLIDLGKGFYAPFGRPLIEQAAKDGTIPPEALPWILGVTDQINELKAESENGNVYLRIKMPKLDAPPAKASATDEAAKKDELKKQSSLSRRVFEVCQVRAVQREWVVRS